jgi:hypothetical protein
MKTWFRYTAATLFLLMTVSACDDSPVVANDEQPDAALVSIYLTDAPGDVENVWVEVLEIYLQGGPGGRTVLLDEPTELIELTALVGTAQPLVLDEEIEPGVYQQLRFVIGGAVLETSGGDVYSKDGAEHPDGLATTGNLICPSCSQTGIKVVTGSTQLELGEGTHDVLLDFDVSQSFGRQAGQSGNWVMRPVIHGIDMVAMGSIRGTVALAEDAQGNPLVTIPECPDGTARTLAHFIPTATAVTLEDDEGQPIVRTGVTDGTGQFSILALVPDSYELGYTGTIELTDHNFVWTANVTTPSPATVSVSGGEEVTGVVYTITNAQCVSTT